MAGGDTRQAEGPQAPGHPEPPHAASRHDPLEAQVIDAELGVINLALRLAEAELAERATIETELEIVELGIELEARRADLAAGTVPADVTRALFDHERAARVDFAAMDVGISRAASAHLQRLTDDRAAFLDLLRADLSKYAGGGEAGSILRPVSRIVNRLDALTMPGGNVGEPIEGLADLLDESRVAHGAIISETFDKAVTEVRAEASRQGLRLGAPAARTLGDEVRLSKLEQKVVGAGPGDVAAKLRDHAYSLPVFSEVDPYTPERLVDELIAHGESLSTGPLSKLAKETASVSHGEGRNAGARNIERPARVYASELLDRNTCDPCAAVDGTEYATVEESEADYPDGRYIECEGGDLCRGTRVFVWEEEAPPTEEVPGDRPLPGAGTPGGPPVPGTPRAPEARGTKVSGALDYSAMPKANAPVVERTLAAIDSVHGDGALPDLPVKQNNRMRRTLGHYRWTYDGESVEISVKFSASNPHPGLTLAHEVGHFIDHRGFMANTIGLTDAQLFELNSATRGPWATASALQDPDSLLAEWFAATNDSEAVQGLRDIMSSWQLPNGARASGAHVRYLLDVQEVWARSYAQYVATRSEDAVLKAELADYLAKYNGYGSQWSEEDFAPIASAMDRLFAKMGWRL